jgi:hypothetical protein
MSRKIEEVSKIFPLLATSTNGLRYNFRQNFNVHTVPSCNTVLTCVRRWQGAGSLHDSNTQQPSIFMPKDTAGVRNAVLQYTKIST